MCGIFGYIGVRDASPLLVHGLELLEYRGYDSAGVAVLDGSYINVRKVPGKINGLRESVLKTPLGGTAGIGHTRWATHGAANAVNAHPHLSANVRVAVVHNGIIENHEELRRELRAKGFLFQSETDTEVLPHLIELELRAAQGFEDAVARALSHVTGAYAIAVISADHPDELIVARNSGELVIGIGEHELFVSSDRTTLAEYAPHVVCVQDGEIVRLCRDGVFKFRSKRIEENASRLEDVGVSADVAGRSTYPHIMLKEIYEQPQSLRNTLRGRLDAETGAIKLGGFGEHAERLCGSERIVIIGCGTSLYAGMAGKLLIEQLARIPVDVDCASEYRYRKPIIGRGVTVIGISQSGETADTLRALALAKENGALCLGITNRVGSALSRLVHSGMYLHAGPEYAVASTKAFTSQVALLTLVALRIASARGTAEPSRVSTLALALGRISELLEEMLNAGISDRVADIAAGHRDAKRIICLGRGFGLPLAYEGALKLKEVAYVDAHGYPAGELKHGPLALVEDGTPVIALVRRGELREKMLSNMTEVVTRGGSVIAITTQGDSSADTIARHTIALPDTPEELTPVICAIPLQLLAYHLGCLRGNDVDQPRNLAKSVSVE